MLRAVLFEIDDVLLPDRALRVATLALVCERIEEQLRVPPGTLGAAVEAIGSARFDSLDPAQLGTRHAITWEQCLWAPLYGAPKELPGLAGLAAAVRRTTWSDAVSACGGAPATAADLEARYARERRARMKPVPEAGPLVAALRDRALLVGCVTSGASVIQRVKLRDSGLESLFDVLVITGEEGAPKEGGEVVRLACDRLGVSPAEALMVGPSPSRDLAGAAAAGAQGLLVERGEVGGPEPHRRVFEPQGLLAYADGLRAGKEVRLLSGRVPFDIDTPVAEGGAWQARVGPEKDELRPAIQGSTRVRALEASLRAVRARAGETVRHELGEEVDWDALLR